MGRLKRRIHIGLALFTVCPLSTGVQKSQAGRRSATTSADRPGRCMYGALFRCAGGCGGGRPLNIEHSLCLWFYYHPLQISTPLNEEFPDVLQLEFPAPDSPRNSTAER